MEMNRIPFIQQNSPMISPDNQKLLGHFLYKSLSEIFHFQINLTFNLCRKENGEGKKQEENTNGLV